MSAAPLRLQVTKWCLGSLPFPKTATLLSCHLSFLGKACTPQSRAEPLAIANTRGHSQHGPGQGWKSSRGWQSHQGTLIILVLRPLREAQTQLLPPQGIGAGSYKQPRAPSPTQRQRQGDRAARSSPPEPAELYLLMELTLGTVSLSHTRSARSLSLISQANMVGFWRLYSAIFSTTLGVATFGFDPPITPGLILPVS